MPPSVLIFGGWHGRSWLLGVCGTNEYTDAQVGDAGGLFESLDPAPCGAVPVHPVYRSSSSLPTSYPVPVYFVQCSSSSLPTSYPVPVYFVQCSSSSLPTSYPVPVYFVQCSSSSLPTSYPVPVYFVQCSSSSLLCPRTSPVLWGFFPVIPLHLQAMQVPFCVCTRKLGPEEVSVSLIAV